jgi:hypothetical protein
MPSLASDAATWAKLLHISIAATVNKADANNNGKPAGERMGRYIVVAALRVSPAPGAPK